MPNKIEISSKSIIFFVFFLIGLWFIYEVREIIFLVFVAFILMAAIKPWVEKLEKIKIPRFLSVFVIYIFIILTLVYILIQLVPPMTLQLTHFIESLPKYLSKFIPANIIDTQTIISQVGPLSQNIVQVTLGIFSNIISFVTIFVLSIYMTLGRGTLDKFSSEFLGAELAGKLINILKQVEFKLGVWVSGQVTLMLVIGIFTFIGITLLGLPFAFPLAVIAGILEIIPNIGPIMSAVPAVLVALSISPVMALVTALVYFTIQQIENHLVIPIVMNKVVGVPPLVAIIALMIGAKIGGIGGAILSIPLVLLIETIFTEYLKQFRSS